MALKKPNRATWLVVVVLLGQVASYAGSLREVWELDLRKVVQGTPSANAASLPVQLLKFSPDGQQLAVAVAWDTSHDVFKSQLLVVEGQHPNTAAKQFEISAGIGNQEMPSPELFGWSPDGQIIYAAGTIIHIANGKTCEMSETTVGTTVLISNNRLIHVSHDYPDPSVLKAWLDAFNRARASSGNGPAGSFPPPPSNKVSHFTFFDADCQPLEKWDVSEFWDIGDVSVDRSLLLIFSTEGLIVDPFAKNVIRRWSRENGPYGQFADSGKAMCGGGDVVEKGKVPATCWDVDTGTKIGQSSTINGGDPMATAAHSSRIVASSNRRVRRPFFSDNVGSVLDRRVVWDFRSGKELVSWRPKTQSYVDTFNERVEEPFKFTISPDGQYIAEGGNGIIRLYKIEP